MRRRGLTGNMIYYIGLAALIALLAMAANCIRDASASRKTFFALAALAVILFQGFRSFSVGTDLLSYVPGYLNIGRDAGIGLGNLTYQNYEAGYVLLNKLLYMLGLSQRGFLIVCATLIQGPIFYTMYRYSDKPLLSVYTYLAFGNFFFTFSGLRQALAMAICFLAYVLIKEKKPVWFALTILLAVTFHKTAIVCLALYPAYYIRIGKKGLIFSIIIIALMLAFNEKLYIAFRMLYYGSVQYLNHTGAYTMLIMYILLYLVCFCGRPYGADLMGLRNILLILVLITTLAPVSDTISRLGFPMSLYLTILVPKVTMQFDMRPRWAYDALCCSLCLACYLYFAGELGTLPFSFM